MLYCLLLVFLSTFLQSTVDLTLPEIEYLANHVTKEECRKLVLTLHYDVFRLAENVEDVRGVVPDVGCLKLLLHWNSSPGEGRGETHEKLSLRLRQIGRKDLSDWLDSAVLGELQQEMEGAAAGFRVGTEDAEARTRDFAQDDMESEFVGDDIDSWEELVQPAVAVLAVVAVGLAAFLACSRALSKREGGKTGRKRVKRVDGCEYVELR